MPINNTLEKITLHIDELNSNILEKDIICKELQNKLLLSGIFGEVNNIDPNEQFKIRTLTSSKLIKEIENEFTVLNSDDVQKDQLIEEIDKENDKLNSIISNSVKYIESLEEKILIHSEENHWLIEDSEQKNNKLNEFILTSSKIIKDLEEKVIDLNQNLIYKTQIAQQEINKKNQLINGFAMFDFIVFLILGTYWLTFSF